MPAQPTLNQGKLIALEGLDGVGKTTQARLLARHLSHLGLPVILTREPTDGYFGQKIRRIIRHGREGLTPEAELELFIADRREHVQEVIRPALADGKIVITDRYYFSSMAYQGALGLDPLDIQRRHEDFAPQPDLVIILELPLTELTRRLQQRGAPVSPGFEKISYLIQVAAIFDRLDAPFIHRVHGLGSEPEVQARILALICRIFNLPENIVSHPGQPHPTEP
jgi:dTMP kinase